MQIPRDIFKAYDIRALHEQITDDVAERVGYFVAKTVGDPVIVVGRDMRASSDRISATVIKGVRSAGVDAIDIGMVTTSLFNFVISENYQTGLMVTASHNPTEYNGIKVMSHGLPISGHDLYEMIEDEMTQADALGTVREENYLDEYLSTCIDRTQFQGSDFYFVIDYGNGMASTTVQPLMEKLALKPEEMYAEPDDRFPNHEANPAKASTLEDIKKAVVDVGADFGIAFDGDADRIAFIDEKGDAIAGDHLLGIYAQYFLKREGGGVVVGAPNQGKAIRDIVQGAGGKYVDVPIGRTNTIKGSIENDAVIGGELSGHVVFKDMHYLESVDYALLMMMNILKDFKGSMSELVRPLRRYANSGEINTEVEDKEGVMKKIEETFGNEAKTVNKLDGIRMDFDGWWFIVRPSNTEPILRLTVEGEDKDFVQQKAEEIKALMK